MRKHSICALIAAGALAGLMWIPSAALSQGTGTADGDSVTGVVVATTGLPPPDDHVRTSFDAHSGPAGENPTGTVVYESVTYAFTGFVTCLRVTGNTATIGVTFDAGAGATFWRVYDVRDGGVGGQDAYFVRGGSLGSGPTTCPTMPPPLASVESGDIVVHDAPELPVSKAQCKDDGWKSFGDTFKNQGQCVAFVERGPK